MENQENKVAEMTPASIDRDVLEILATENTDLLKAISSDEQMKRTLLNFLCEIFSVIKNLQVAIEQQNRILTICSADKMRAFFKEVNTNIENPQTEDVTEESEEKIKES